MDRAEEAIESLKPEIRGLVLFASRVWERKPCFCFGLFVSQSPGKVISGWRRFSMTNMRSDAVLKV